MRSRAGFTLIELLIIVAVLGLIAALVIPNLVDYYGGGDPMRTCTCSGLTFRAKVLSRPTGDQPFWTLEKEDGKTVEASNCIIE